MPRVVITGDERRYNQVAAVEDAGLWRMFIPFPGLWIKQACLVGDDRLVCLSSPTDDDLGAELCLVAWRSGEELARQKTRIAARIHVTGDARFILVIGETSLHALRADDLLTLARGTTVRWETAPTPAGRWRGQLVHPVRSSVRGPEDPVLLHTGKVIYEDAAGRLFFMCYNAGPQRHIRYAICHIDRGDWTLSAAPIDETSGQWLWFSPSRRLALARHVRTLAYDDGVEEKNFFGFAKRPSRHRDVRSDGLPRFGRALELWNTEPPDLKAMVVVRMDAIHAVIDPSTRRPVPGAWLRFAQHSAERPAENVAPKWTPTRQEIRAHPERQLWAMLHDRMLNMYDVAWEPDESGFWIQFGQSSKTMVLFRRAGLDGSLSPLFAFARFRNAGEPVHQAFAGFPDGERLAIRTGAGHVYIRREWCEDAAAFRLIAENEDGLEPHAIESARVQPPMNETARALGSTRVHVVIVPEFSRDDVASALTDLAQEVRTRLGEMVWKEAANLVFEMSFVVAGDVVPEVDFFRRVSKARLPVAPELRGLLTAYLAALPPVLSGDIVHEQVWGAPDTGAFGFALQALMLLDATALDVFRDYLALRDGEHEKYSTDVIMPSFIAAHGWRNDEILRFGIYFALIRERDGTHAREGFVNEYGLLDAAERMLGAAEFAAMIDEEIDAFVRVFANKDLTRRTLHCALQRSLVTRPYGERVLQTMGGSS